MLTRRSRSKHRRARAAVARGDGSERVRGRSIVCWVIAAAPVRGPFGFRRRCVASCGEAVGALSGGRPRSPRGSRRRSGRGPGACEARQGVAARFAATSPSSAVGRAVRGLRQSLTIATSPGVSTTRPVSDLTGLSASTPPGRQTRRSGRTGRLARRASGARDPAGTTRRRSRGLVHNYKRMNGLSKDGASWLTIGDEAAGQRIDNFLQPRPQGRAQEPHLPDPALRGGARERRRVGPDARLALGDVVRVPPVRTAAPDAPMRLPAGRRAAGRSSRTTR